MSNTEFLFLDNQSEDLFFINLKKKTNENFENLTEDELKSKIKNIIESEKRKKEELFKNTKIFKKPIFTYQTERIKDGKKEYILYVLKNDKEIIKTSKKPFKIDTFEEKKYEVSLFKNKKTNITCVESEEGIENMGNSCFIASAIHLLFPIFCSVEDKNKLLEVSFEESNELGNLVKDLITGKKINKILIEKLVDNMISKGNSSGKDLKEFKTQQCDSMEFVQNFFLIYNKIYSIYSKFIKFELCNKYFGKKNDGVFIDLISLTNKKTKISCLKGGATNIPPPPPPPPPMFFVSKTPNLKKNQKLFDVGVSILDLNVNDHELNFQKIIDNNFNFDNTSAKSLNNLNTTSISSFQNTNIYKKIFLKNTNKYIICNLKPYSYDPLTNNKILFTNFKLNNQKDEQINIPILDENNEEKILKYKIHDIVFHKGTSINIGHYVCLSKRKNKWYLYDDSGKKDFNRNNFNEIDGKPYFLLLEKVI